VLNNLLSNACKFTSVGKIAVEAVRTAQVGNRMELFFMVIDSGIGIDKKDQDKLFQSFTQVDNTISRKYGGTGLGLNISKQLVEMMGGSISVESEKNKGTMFNFSVWVELPESELNGPMKKVDAKRIIEQAHDAYTHQLEDGKTEFGSKENLEEIRNKMSKLILSVEMQNWEKAEMFMDTLKQLMAEAPREIKSGVLKLKMAVQKADYDKIVQAFEGLQALLEAQEDVG